MGSSASNSSSRSKSKPPPYVWKPIDDHTEDILEALKRFDTVLVLDDSGSMQGARWKQAGQALAELAAAAARYDADGIEIHFLNSRESHRGVTDPAEVEALFKRVRPQGLTPLGAKLQMLLKRYQRRLEDDKNAATTTTKPVNLIVITDGAPTDGDVLEKAIVEMAGALDRCGARPAQVGIQFVQIGDDEGATAFLQKLDDDLAKLGVRDKVDTTLPEGRDLDLVKILIGAVNRRVDNKGSQAMVLKD